MANKLNVIYKAPRCRFLLSKSMYVNAGLPPGEEVVGDEGDDFWCARNQTNYGPDQRLCDPNQCRDDKRRCYEAS